MATMNREYCLTLSPDEAYTLQILLGYVAADAECYSVAKKLVDLTGEGVDIDDYDRVVVSVEGCCYSNKVETDEYETVVIRFV